jgi:hypothetical protein
MPNDACRPTERKLAAVRYLYTRMNNYQLPPDKKKKEETQYNKFYTIMDTTLQSPNLYLATKN